MLTLHAITGPTLAGHLHRIRALLDRARSDCADDPAREAELLAAALAPGMFALEQQFKTAIDFAPRIACPLAGRSVPAAPDTGPGFAGLDARAAATLARVEALPADAFVAPDHPIRFEAGHARPELPALAFLLRFGLPNMLFHMGQAYAILRANGVPVGKADFDGLHAYPPGFTFVP